MARPLRIEYPGAMYHVMARGNQGHSIFGDDSDRKRFLETLAEACEKTGWGVHAYVLMGNHYHLLVETPEGNLVAGMKWLQGTYTQRYNGRHKQFGHLFQGRYKAAVVDGKDANYLQVVSSYIHLNPARAGLIRIGREKLGRYRWSSYPWYLSRQCPVWLRREAVKGSLRLRAGDRRGYEAYLEGRVLELGMKTGRKDLEQSWKAIRRGWYLGEPSFLEKLERWLAEAVKGRQRQSHSGAAREAHDTAAAERLLQRGLKALQLKAADLAGLPKAAPEKVALAWWLRRRTTVPLRWVAERLQMGQYTRVTQAVSRMSRKPGRQLRLIRERLLALESENYVYK
ncbi:MAG: transposase [Limisphaerales bacterium]